MVTWDEDPQFKVEAGATDFSTDGLTVTVHRPENAISRTLISANDYQGKHYIANIDAFTVIKVSLRYGAGGWTQVFEGVTERVGPKLDARQTIELTAYGYGRALRNTHCSKDYGNESEDPSLNTPHEIWDDIIDNMINLSFGGAATGYAITKVKIAPAANPDINFIEGGYRNNFTMIHDILMAYQGYRAGLSGMHWFVDESKNLFINTIAAHENNASGWPTWWRTDQAGSTLVEGTDFTSSLFSKTVQPHFANKIVLYCNLRKPGADIWSEDNGPVWGVANCAYSYSATQKIVGSHSLKIEPNNQPAAVYCYYPSTADADWDFTKIGSPKNVPTLNWYEWITTVNMAARSVLLFKDLAVLGGLHGDDYFAIWHADDYTVPANINEWIHFNFPVGPYWKTPKEARRFNWNTVGAPDWSEVNGICFALFVPSDNTHDTFVDDLHFSGKIIREAFNSTNITANDEVQKIIRYDVAVDDSMDESDASGTAGRLAYGELLTRQVIPTVGVIVTPLAEDALPGQLIHIHSDWYSAGNWRINADFRVKEIIHTITESGATTAWDVTSDVLNTFVPGLNNALSTYHQLIHTDPEMKNLRTTEFDPSVSRLSIDYP